MAGFIDVVLRGLLLALTSGVLGGVAWATLVLRAGAGVKPDPGAVRALRAVGIAAALAALTQGAIVLVALSELADVTRGWPIGPFFDTTFARTALARLGLAGAVTVLALTLARRAAGRLAWTALAAAALGLVVSSSVLSHAIARVEDRGLLLALDATHQAAAAIWVGGLAHLTLWVAGARRASRAGAPWGPPARDVVRRFSTLAFASVSVLLVAGIALTVNYVGDAAALVGTAYGVMVLSKVGLLVAALGLAAANRRAVHAATADPPGERLYRFVEVELGLGLTLLFAAASLTSLPPSVDVREDRASVAEVASRFTPTMPRLASPPHDELIRTADPLMAPPGERKPVERAWSEYNHHWSGLFVLLMGLLAAAERLGVRAARHWPLLFFGLATFMFIRNDPRAWPLGPTGFWESLTLPDVLQHRTFVVLIVVFGTFEWMVRTNRLPRRPWAFVFPLLCAVGGGMLLTHSHAMFNLKDEFLTEVTHAPLGILGAFAGWGRWLELRLPESAKTSGWVWIACLASVGALLLVYREG
ncbi:MAG: CopD family protein [Candidatus Rokubacteria bacterium]|nr:CopD family protein [Candidatus Rokubacteria bacterium]